VRSSCKTSNMAHFASLNGAADYAAGVDNDDFDFDFRPDPNTMARRSISIFSRRGTETPEPKPPFIAQAAMATNPVPHLKREMTERQKSWLGRRCSVGGGKSTSKPPSPAQKKPKGTILNAVPPAKIIRMTALEEEMATSPNEEILSAVSEHSPTQVAFTARSHQTPQGSPINQTSTFWSKPSAPLAQRTRSEKKRDKNSRIGIWVNGIAQWDDQILVGNAHEQHRQWVEEAVREETGFTPLHTHTAVHPALRGERPTLSVVIPNGDEPMVNTTALSTIVQPRPQRPVVSVAPASIVSRFNIVTPAITITEEANEEHDVSPLESVQHTPTLNRNMAMEQTHLDVVSPESVRPRAFRESSSSAGSSLGEQDDKSSIYSKRSSATSIEAPRIAIPKRSSKRLSGRALTRVSPAASSEDLYKRHAADLNKPLPPDPHPIPVRAAPTPCTLTRSNRRASSASLASAPASRLRPQSAILLARSRPSTRSLSRLDKVDAEFLRNSPYASHSDFEAESPSDGPSESEIDEPMTPTLSQAEDELQAHLNGISSDVYYGENDSVPLKPTAVERCDSILAKTASIRRNDSVRSVMQPPERAPTLPRRSRKRDWRSQKLRDAPPARQPTRRRSDSNIRITLRHEAMHRSLSVTQHAMAHEWHVTTREQPTAIAQELTQPQPPRIVIDDGLIVVQGPTILGEDGSVMTPIAVAAASAEEVLLHILASLSSMDDLASTALINKGMYRVYKEHEMHLIRSVCNNQSPPAHEFREWCPPERNTLETSSRASSQLEHTPQSYVRCYRRDVAVIESLKALILDHCQTFIRRETAFALSTPTHPNAQRFNDAFWRIWCFCKIFGCEKGREDDVTGQLDWLKGGLLANNQDLAATVNTNLEFEMSSILLNPPDHFAKGNAGGLTAQQLYDMTEIWGCLEFLMQGYHGRVDQARDAGVFAECDDVVEGDVEREEQVLEEWTHHLLTLGPTVVLEMAQHAFDSSAAGFALAKLNGFTKWTENINCSRNTFLKEPVARLYEERVAAAKQALENPREREKKEMSRKRVATLAAEIKLKRQSSNYRRSPYIDMKAERSMSVVSRRSSTTSHSARGSQRSLVSPLTTSVPQYTFASSTVATPLSAVPNFSHPHAHPQMASHQMVQVPGSPTQWSPRKISPIIEERVENFNRLSLQNVLAGEADNTSDRAVQKIMEMGFTLVQASHALRTTDMGDGLQVDRALDFLLRQRM
jgi:hypothetical protein